MVRLREIQSCKLAEMPECCGVIGARGFHGIARVPEIHEAHPLDDAAAVDIEAWDEALAEHDR